MNNLQTAKRVLWEVGWSGRIVSSTRSKFRLLSVSTALLLAVLIAAWLGASARMAQAQGNPGYGEMMLWRTLPSFGAVSGVAFSPDGQIVAGITVNHVLLWNLEGEVLKTLQSPSEAVLAVAFSPDGKTLATAGSGRDATVVLWDIASGEQKRTLTRHLQSIGAIAFSPDGLTLLSGSDDGKVLLHNTTNGSLQQTYSESRLPVAAVGFTPDGKTSVSLHAPWGERVCEVVIGEAPNNETSTHKLTDMERPFVYSPINHLVAGVTNGRRNMRVWNIKEDSLSPMSEGVYENISALAFAPDGRALAAVSGQVVTIWDGTELWPLKDDVFTHGAKVLAACFSPDGRVVATASADKTVRLWRAPGARR